MKENQNVTVLDNDSDVIDNLGGEFTESKSCDAVNIKELEDVDIKHFDYVIVGIDNVEKSISICSNLKELGVIRILAQAKDEVHKRILKLMGIIHSIIPELYVAENLAYQTMFDIEVEKLPYSKEECENEIFIFKLNVYNSKLREKKISSLLFLKENNASILSIKRMKKGSIIFPVSEDEKLERSDEIILIARKESINKLKESFQKNIPVNLLEETEEKEGKEE
ncbi:potassium channel family protein [Mycoplasma suis]|uniref:Potassium uptake protein KTRA n=1 Tax=Mycoplasma suis (strain Illinois) TaxID=768700 RepID=F0QR92_MYCSL|nr:TrkA family potassium uptake protein [Mycoplasma suis]ADX98012.1 potassium uptake protein KTRA [Mycoplasma suis str. Illinois]